MKNIIIALALLSMVFISGCTATTGQVVMKEGCSPDWVSPQPPITSLVRMGDEPNAGQLAEDVCKSICLSRAEVRSSRLLDPRFVEGVKYSQCQCDLNDCSSP